MSIIVESLQNFVKRGVPIRFGLVPKAGSPDALAQARVVYSLLETHGLGAVLAYLEKVGMQFAMLQSATDVC